jgi:hypothetical protein
MNQGAPVLIHSILFKLGLINYIQLVINEICPYGVYNNTL